MHLPGAAHLADHALTFCEAHATTNPHRVIKYMQGLATATGMDITIDPDKLAREYEIPQSRLQDERVILEAYSATESLCRALRQPLE